MVNLWREIPSGDKPPEEINAVIEVISRSRDKYEYHEEWEVFVLDRVNTETISAAAGRFLHLDTEKSRKYYRQCREITIDTDPDQPVWSDGEYLGRTPVTVKVLPGMLPIVVP